jgi:glycogen(starch) synthase
MRILIASHAFSPSIGGIESVSLSMAFEFIKQGHEVRIVTQSTSDDAADDHGFEVLRQPSPQGLFDAVRWCDVFWHNNLGIRAAWPLLLLKRPFVVTHQGSYCEIPPGLQLASRLKHAMVNCSTNVSISSYVARCFSSDSIVIPNTYQVQTFKITQSSEKRSRNLVFVGRLVTEKGVDILLRSLSKLRDKGEKPALSVVGLGPEMPNLQKLAVELGVDSQVSFLGPQRGVQLAQTLNEHKILIVPSRYKEPFGVVALEGIACGCAVIASEGGGLPEAVGPCGLTFPNGNIEALASSIHRLLGSDKEREALALKRAEHLTQFHPETVARAYLDVFRAATAG